MFSSCTRPDSYAAICGVWRGSLGTTVNVSDAGAVGGWFGVGP